VTATSSEVVEVQQHNAVSFSGNSETHANGSLVSPRSPLGIPSDWDGTEIPDEVLAHPLLSEAAWVELRDSGRNPLDCTETVTTYQARVEFLVGAWILDKVVPRRLGGSLLANLQPQMLMTCDVLAAERFRNAILEPRRSAKTTSLWCIAVGRCWMRPQYMVGYTMLTLAKKAEERFELDVRDPITIKWRDKRTRPIKIEDGKGDKGLQFANFSKLAILAPKGEDVRSGAYDMLIMDEAGEAEPAVWEDIVAAVVPSFDTRGEGAQLVFAGTGGKYRTGSYFWKTLHDPDAGRIRYGVPDDIDPTILADWDTAGPLIEAMHPGLDGLTTLEKIAGNFADLGADRFALEYFGHFGDETGTQTAISVAAWKKGKRDGPVPEGITTGTLALAVHPFGLWASVAVAWHYTPPADLATLAWALDGEEPEDQRHFIGVKLIHHQRGTDGLERIVLTTSRRLGTPIIYDKGTTQSKAAIERTLSNARPRPAITEYDLQSVKVAHAQLLTGLERGDIIHWAQAPLDKAAEAVVRQSMGQGFLIRAPKSDDNGDATPFEAIALAVDALPDRPTSALNAAAVIEFN